MGTVRRTWTVAVVVAMAVLGLAGCGGGASDEDDPAADTTAAKGGDDGGTTTTAKGTGGAYPSCPLTVEQVATVTGEPMEMDRPDICQFHPTSGKATPNILFVKQSSILSDEDVRNEAGYPTKVDGIGDEAYTGPANVTGTSVLARDGQQWFEVEVDVLSDEATELDWAKQLATVIADDN